MSMWQRCAPSAIPIDRVQRRDTCRMFPASRPSKVAVAMRARYRTKGRGVGANNRVTIREAGNGNRAIGAAQVVVGKDLARLRYV